MCADGMIQITARGQCLPGSKTAVTIVLLTNKIFARLIKFNRDSGIDNHAIIDLENDTLLNPLEPPSAEFFDHF